MEHVDCKESMNGHLSDVIQEILEEEFHESKWNDSIKKHHFNFFKDVEYVGMYFNADILRDPSLDSERDAILFVHLEELYKHQVFRFKLNAITVK